MDIEKISGLDITGRKVIPVEDLEKGHVYAFAEEYDGRLRKGLIVLSGHESHWFTWAINLYKEEGRLWFEDEIPDKDILYFEATREETMYGLMQALDESFYCLPKASDIGHFIDTKSYLNSIMSMVGEIQKEKTVLQK